MTHSAASQTVAQMTRCGLVALEPGEDARKLSINGALMLYLDFINLFLYLLRFFGRRRE